MKILYNLFLFLLIGLLIFSNSSQLDFLNMVNQTIKINVKGNAVKDKVYTLKRGSTVEDLLGIIEHMMMLTYLV